MGRTTDLENLNEIDVIGNSVNVGFPQLIWGYKQTITIKASRCITVHDRVTNVFDKFTISGIPQSFNCKSVCNRGLAGKTQNILKSRLLLQNVSLFGDSESHLYFGANKVYLGLR